MSLVAISAFGCDIDPPLDAPRIGVSLVTVAADAARELRELRVKPTLRGSRRTFRLLGDDVQPEMI
jgi:hypothetical protein